MEQKAASPFAVEVNQAGSCLLYKVPQGTAPATRSLRGIALLPDSLLNLSWRPVTSTVLCVQEIDVSPFVPFSDADVTRQAALRWSSLPCQNAAAPGKKPTFPYAGRRCCWRQSCLSACDQTTCHAAAGSRLRDTTLLSLAAQDAMAQRHDEDMRL